MTRRFLGDRQPVRDPVGGGGEEVTSEAEGQGLGLGGNASSQL